ncbi:hypothetical protein M514_05823 [Trichuris suis]|uniref:Uncharacterized protein n=1 Tax=Trichuris suis TaxID=68888 RepID=A0A085NAE1_9BILA|nr:hypothetical protein M513_05823 [Trichuris suis]KFD66437.1 hypothetical protein M514_05823 [Trichuris suis]
MPLISIHSSARTAEASNDACVPALTSKQMFAGRRSKSKRSITGPLASRNASPARYISRRA